MTNLRQKEDDEYIGSTITVDVFHYAVHEGIAFATSLYHASGDLYCCFRTPNTENYLHMLWSISAENNSLLNVWEGVTAGAGGSDQVVYNRNRTAVDGGGASAVIAGNTSTVGAVQVGQAFSGGTQLNPQGFFAAKNGGSQDAGQEFVLEKNTWYGFHVDNIMSKDIGVILNWFEVPHL